LVGIDQEQRLVIAVADSLLGGLLAGTARDLLSYAVAIQVTDLLNLDGGGSAQLYVKSGSVRKVSW
jgi:exopolysaccharide biosynthesis protein